MYLERQKIALTTTTNEDLITFQNNQSETARPLLWSGQHFEATLNYFFPFFVIV